MFLNIYSLKHLLYTIYHVYPNPFSTAMLYYTRGYMPSNFAFGNRAKIAGMFNQSEITRDQSFELQQNHNNIASQRHVAGEWQIPDIYLITLQI